MRDMYSELEAWLAKMDIFARLETRAEAAVACREHGTDIEGRNNADVLGPYEEPSKAEKLKEQGNRHFAAKRYAQAIAKWVPLPA
jgi:hypothetical protein